MRPRPTLPIEARRRLILARYARIGKKGKPAICVSTASSKTKVIFSTAEQAQAAADELTTLLGVQQYIYPCPQSRKGHHHLTTNPPRTEPTTEDR